jgi:hypothetical protein
VAIHVWENCGAFWQCQIFPRSDGPAEGRPLKTLKTDFKIEPNFKSTVYGNLPRTAPKMNDAIVCATS